MITACISRSWKVEVCQKNKNSLEEIISNQQQGPRQVRNNANVFVSYVPTRPLALDRQTITATESGTTATTKRTAYISLFWKGLLGEKKHQKNDAPPGRMHATHWFLPWTLSIYYDLRVAQLNSRKNDYFSPYFLCRKCIPCLLVHLAQCRKIRHRQKACCV